MRHARICRRFSAMILALLTVSTAVAKESQSQPTVPAGLQISVRLKDKLRSDKNKTGDPFRGRLESPITADGRVLYPRGTEVAGYVVRSHASDRPTDPGVLELDLLSVGSGTKIAALTAKTLVLRGESLKGGKAETGGTAADATRKRDSAVEANAVLTWISTQPGATPNWLTNPPGDVRRGASGTPFRIVRHDEEKPDQVPGETRVFSEKDRRILRQCLSKSRTGSSGNNPVLSPTVVRQLQKDRILTPALQKKVQPLPSACAQQLSPVPGKWARGVLSGRVLLLDPKSKINDLLVF